MELTVFCAVIFNNKQHFTSAAYQTIKNCNCNLLIQNILFKINYLFMKNTNWTLHQAQYMYVFQIDTWQYLFEK